MRDQSIRTHLANLEQQGELVRFTAEVDPDANMSALAWKSFAELGKSCLFENLKGHPGWRAVAQIIANRRKWAIALGVEEADVVATLTERIAHPVATVDVERDTAPCKEVVAIGDEVDLTRLPAMWTSEKDPGRYIAAGMCIIKDPDTGIRNMSFHRAQIIGPDRTAFLICPRQALQDLQMYGARGRPMEVAMVIGAHPLIAFAAGFVAPYGTDELTVAGGLLGDAVRMVECETIDMEVPADAELVLEGEIYPGERAGEGPFGEVTGTYAQEGSTPVFRIKAVTHRKRPDLLCHAMRTCAERGAFADLHHHRDEAVGAHARDRRRRARAPGHPLHRRDVADDGGGAGAAEISGPGAGGARRGAVEPLSPSQIRRRRRRGHRPADVNQVMWAIATRTHAARDVQRINATRVFTLDNASPIEEGMSAMYRVGTKMAIDATRPMTGERRRFDRVVPPNFAAVDLADYLV